MLGRINYDDFPTYRASGRSTQQVLSIIPPTIYLAGTLADTRHIKYLIGKHTHWIIDVDVVVAALFEGAAVLAEHPDWFVEVDHWIRPQLPGRVWEVITEQNHRYMEATNARNDGHNPTERTV